MKEYTGDRIRNVAIVGHGGAGTTSVTEALLYRSGAISRMCKVEDGATTTDYEPEEIKRGVSVNATLAPVEWRDTKINFIDTPGFADFVAEVKGAFRAVDSALIVVCATSGVQVGTEQCWKLAEEAHLPRIIFVNKMDRENADFDSILDNLRAKIGKRVLPLQLPLGKEADFCGVIDLYKMKAYKANGNDSIEMDIPEDMLEYAKEAHEKMVEAAVEADDDCMMRYLEGETISDEEIMDCLIKGIRQAIIFPVLCGSAYKDIGLGRVMNAIIDFTYPAILNDFVVTNPETEEEEIRDANAPMAALVFKTTSDPFVGRLSFFRVFSGTIKSDSMVYNASREKEERIGGIFTMRGKTQIPMKEVVAGDIGVTTKLQFTSTGDTLSDKNSPVLFAPIAFPLPMYTRAIYAKKKGEEEKIATALNRLMDEDPTIIVTKNSVTKETLVSGMGDQHIEIIMERMKRKFGVEADLRAPIVEYRETIRGTAEVEGKHKKQSGGAGQFGEVHLIVEPYYEGMPMPETYKFNGQEFKMNVKGVEEVPLEWGGKLVFVNSIVGGSIDARFMPAILKGIMSRMEQGPLTGSYARDVRVIVYDGKMHPVDSNEISFMLAGRNAFSEAFKNAGPKILEPIYDVEVFVPSDKMGDVMGDLQGRRAMIMGMSSEAGYEKLIAKVPLKEMSSYSTALSSLTGGRASFIMKFASYELVPSDVQDKLIKEFEAKQADE